jgi:hypothetical protein
VDGVDLTDPRRTGHYVPEIDGLLVAAPASDSGEAALMIYRSQP